MAPLAVYLLTFIVAFSRASATAVRLASALLPVLAAAVLLSLLNVLDVFRLPIALSVGLHLLTLLCAATLVHGRLAAERPPADRLTEFYVLLSVGGVLGGVFNALLAPQLFDSVLEYPLALVLALLLRPSAARSRRWTFRFAWTADFLLPFLVFVCTIAAIAASSWGDRTPEPGGVVTSGILVAGAAALFSSPGTGSGSPSASPCSRPSSPSASRRCTLSAPSTAFFALSKGPRASTTSSTETACTASSFARGRVGEPLSYHTRSGPIGDVFRLYQAEAPFGRVGLVELGVGSLAAYGRAGQTFEFYEIDPAVIEIANDARWFTFLRDSRARVSTVAGDARRSLERAPRGANDLLVVDAFSSDSIPVHLLTREAVQLYLGTVRTEGLIAFHVSNTICGWPPWSPGSPAAWASPRHIASISSPPTRRSAALRPRTGSWSRAP